MKNKDRIQNWKLKEIEGKYQVIANNSIQFRDELLTQLKLPLSDENAGLYRQDTNIDWTKMPEYHKFFFDLKGWEELIKEWLKKSKIAESQNLIIIYGWKEPVVKIPTELFLEDWEGFIRSTLWETIIFSEDYKLIMEVSRDYCLHSNFRIVPEEYENHPSLKCDEF